MPKQSSLLPGILLALSMHALAQTPPSATAPYRIAGHIVSATDGRPLQRATVEILESKSRTQVGSVVSGEDGSFAFADLKPGNFVLQGKASGFLPSEFQEHAGFFTGVVTGAGVDTESLVLKLTPEADISGRVTDEAGDPVRRANMVLYRESRDTGITHTTRVGATQTDATGTYDIAHLAPGKYFLAAKATPWYAVHPQPAAQAAPTGVVDSVDPSLDVAYPTTFFADATDSSSATPIQLKGGDQTELDIRLYPQTAVRITIPRAPQEMLSGDAPIADRMRVATQNNQPPQLQLQKKVFDGLEAVSTEMRGFPTEFSYVGIPPGQYVMKEMNPRAGGVTKSSNITLTERSTQFDPTRGEESGTLKILLKTADGGKLPPHSQISIVGKQEQQRNAQAVNDKGEAEIRGVDPGEYHFLASLGSKPFVVSRLVSDGKALPANRIQITAGQTLSITVVVSPAAYSTLSGFAQADGKPAGGAMVLLLPVDEVNRTDYATRDQSNLDGSFSLANIPPGRYILTAIQDGWDLEWQRDDVLAHYLPQGIAITIPAPGNATIKLPTPLPVQPR